MNDYYSDAEQKIIGMNVKRIREKLGWSQEAFAATIHKSVKTVQRIEKGEGGKLYEYDVKNFADNLMCAKEELFLTNYELSKKMLYEKAKDFTLPVANLSEIKFQSIYDFIIYSPLIDPYMLLDTLCRFSFETDNIEFYIAQCFNKMYESIKNAPARKYAEFISRCLTIKGKKISELKANMFGPNEFSRCEAEYYKEVRNFRKLLPFAVNSPEKTLESYNKYIDEIAALNPALAKHERLE